jgi:ribosome biogenesis GTPase
MTDRQGVIIKGVGGAYTVLCEKIAYTCTARGIFRNKNIVPLVGDKVEIEITDHEKKFATLHTIKPRENELRRPPAANIEQIIITMATAQPDFNAGLLDRFLLLAEHENIPVIICVNKIDLATAAARGAAAVPLPISNAAHDKLTDVTMGGFSAYEERGAVPLPISNAAHGKLTDVTMSGFSAYEERGAAAVPLPISNAAHGKLTDVTMSGFSAYEEAGYPLVYASAQTKNGLDELRALMSGKINLFAGPSGVGKSSLISALTGIQLETGEISQKLKRGKHTTRHTELIPLGENSEDGYCFDTPGFTSLDIEHIKKNELASLFREFRPFLFECKFNNCLHIRENDCAVKAQVGNAISAARYESYVKLAN